METPPDTHLTDFQQKASGAMAYPARGSTNRFLFKTPLVLWRMGLGPILGNSMLVLTTWGRVSRLPRHTMLSYSPVNDKLYVVSGWGQGADWYRNIQANLHVCVQHGERTFSATARRVVDLKEYTAVIQHLLRTGGDSHFEPWLESLDIQPSLEDLVAKRERVHLLALDPSEKPGPPPMQVDLLWVWPVMLASFAIGWLLGLLTGRFRKG